ncbi:MAG: 1-acyl-sn-glycerol-3-phosphate acyltransferase [Coriobacteriia bacterium]|nr:1-acyl-sn-glycerol-3-phosphate acyltransferase [Coriobacteriia bacterium]
MRRPIPHVERRGLPFSGPESPGWGFAWFVKYGITWIILLMFRVKVRGIEHLPNGAAILACNHVAIMDSIILWSTRLAPWPRHPHFVAKSELYEKPTICGLPWIGWALDMLGALPVTRGGADRTMITRATNLLNHGEWVAIFPEGTRVRDGVGATESMGEALGGAAFLAQRTGAPIVPIGVAGTENIFVPGKRLPRFPKVIYTIGAPLSPDEFEGGRKEKVTAMTAELMARIQVLRDEGEEARTHGG